MACLSLRKHTSLRLSGPDGIFLKEGGQEDGLIADLTRQDIALLSDIPLKNRFAVDGIKGRSSPCNTGDVDHGSIIANASSWRSMHPGL